MCSAFGVPNFGRIVGMCHDAYKDSNEWQAYLMAKMAWERNGKNDPQPALMSHALESAVYLAWRLGNAMYLLGFYRMFRTLTMGEKKEG